MTDLTKPAAPAGPTTAAAGIAESARAASGDPVVVDRDRLTDNMILGETLVGELAAVLERQRATIEQRTGALTSAQRLIAIIAIWIPAMAIIGLSLHLHRYEPAAMFFCTWGAVALTNRISR